MLVDGEPMGAFALAGGDGKGYGLVRVDSLGGFLFKVVHEESWPLGIRVESPTMIPKMLRPASYCLC